MSNPARPPVRRDAGFVTELGSGPFGGGSPVVDARSGILVLAHDAQMTTGRRTMYDMLVAASGRDGNDVMEIRVSERGIQVDVVDFADPGLPIRTFVIDPAATAPTRWPEATRRR